MTTTDQLPTAADALAALHFHEDRAHRIRTTEARADLLAAARVYEWVTRPRH